MPKTNVGERSDAQVKETARRQREHAKSMEALRGGEEPHPVAAGLHVSSMLTTADHVGKVAQEPDKPREMAALGQDQSKRTGVRKVTTVDRKTPGKGTTDKVVTDPPTAAALGQTDAQAPKSEATKVHEAAGPKAKKAAAKSQPKVGAKAK